MRQSHAGGEKLFVDYAGDTVPVTQIFVAAPKLLVPDNAKMADTTSEVRQFGSQLLANGSDRCEHPDIAVVPIGAKAAAGCQFVVTKPLSAKVSGASARSVSTS